MLSWKEHDPLGRDPNLVVNQAKPGHGFQMNWRLRIDVEADIAADEAVASLFGVGEVVARSFSRRHHARAPELAFDAHGRAHEQSSSNAPADRGPAGCGDIGQ